MEQGWDSDVKNYFVKIINTISYGLIFLLTSATAGLYFRLGYPTEKPIFYVILFYSLFLLGLFLLIRYYVRIWSK